MLSKLKPLVKCVGMRTDTNPSDGYSTPHLYPWALEEIENKLTAFGQSLSILHDRIVSSVQTALDHQQHGAPAPAAIVDSLTQILNNLGLPDVILV